MTRYLTMAGGLAALAITAACSPTPGQPGSSAQTTTAPARAGAPLSQSTASGQNAVTNQTMGGGGTPINRPYYLGADPNFPEQGSGVSGKPSGTGP